VYTRIYSATDGDAWLNLKSETVLVSAGQSTPLDLTMTPCIIQGTVTITGGSSLTQINLMAKTTNESPYRPGAAVGKQVIDNSGGLPVALSESTFSLPVRPGKPLFLWGSLRTNGGHVNLPGRNIATCTAGDIITQNWTIHHPIPPRFPVTGTIELRGLSNANPSLTPAFNYHAVNYLGMLATSNTNGGQYTPLDLPIGNHRASAYTFFGNSRYGYYHDRFVFPYSSFQKPMLLNVNGTATSVNDIYADAAFLNWHLTLIGNKEVQDTHYIQFRATGVKNTPTYGGQGLATSFSKDGVDQVVVSAGEWDVSKINIHFSGGNVHYSNLEIVDNTKNPVTLAAGQTLDIIRSYETGTATIHYSVSTGESFHSPHLNGSATNNTYLSTVTARGQWAQDPIPLDQVVFVGLPGTYSINTYATVNGVKVQFGKLSVTLRAGQNTNVYTEGPRISVTSPVIDQAALVSYVDVTGVTASGANINSVVVNGINALLTSTNNVAKPNEVSFVANIPVSSGVNIIESITTDSSNQIAVDTRKFYVDQGPPSLTWTPNDGLVTAATQINVTGTATDDHTITNLTVNGQSVPFASTINASDPNEVSFSTVINLQDGSHPIVVTTADSSKLVTTQTHVVTKVLNQAPIADAGTYGFVEQSNANGANIILNGTASSDADGDVLSYAWSGPFGRATGISPNVNIPAGISNINLVVNDGMLDSTTSSVIVTVKDTIEPSVTAPTFVNIEATGLQTSVSLTPAAATDAVGVISLSNDAPATFPLGTTAITWRATDSAGNVGTRLQNVNVVDTTSPVLIVPVDVNIEATGMQTPVNIGTATATDIFPVTITHDQPATFSVGITTVTWTATDTNANVSTATQVVSVSDTKAPSVTASLVPIGNGDGKEEDDSDQGRFSIQFVVSDTVDTQPIIRAELIIEGYAVPVVVSNGQLIEFEYEDEKTEVEVENDIVEIEAPSILLRITATDFSGNSTVIEVIPQGLSTDN